MKMNFFFSFIPLTVLTVLAAGCAGTETTIYDPATTPVGIRDDRTISSEEFRIVARAAVNSALTSPKFIAFLKRYQTEKNDPSAIPVLKLDKVVNDTNDPDLNVSEMTDQINEALLNAGKVDVTMAEGQGRSQAIGKSRDLQDDVNFDQKTVAPEGTLIAARLVLRPKIISNVVRDGNRKAVTRTFVMEMADIRTGLLMWKYTKQLAYGKTRSSVGW